MFNAKTVQNFISKEDAEKIVNFAKGIQKWEDSEGTSFWSNRSLSDINIYANYDKKMAEHLYELRQRIGDFIKESYGVEEIYPDLMQIVRWFPGQEQHPHADNMKNTENNQWFHHRDFGALIYLNDDYTGGETYYPQHNQSIVPEAGKLAVHPGTTDHLHGVTKIENSTRYTIASFWTKDRSYYDGWTIS
jgi:hypothetical protein